MTLVAPVLSDGSGSAARSLHKQLLCSPDQSQPAPALSVDMLPFRVTKKRKATADKSDIAYSPPLTKKVTGDVDASSPSPYAIRSRLRRSSSNSSSSSTDSSSPSSPSACPLSPLSPSRSELQAAVVQSFPSHRFCASPLQLYRDAEKGYGVRSSSAIPRHSLICEYAGELLSSRQARTRDCEYALDESLGCYMFYFAWSGADYCIDSTRVPLDDAVRLQWGYGRYINHSRATANLYGRVIGVQGRPHLCFFAKRAIRAGEELLIDYGDRSRESRQAFPWLKN